MWGAIPFGVGRVSATCGARFRCKRGTIPVKWGGRVRSPHVCVTRTSNAGLAGTVFSACFNSPSRASGNSPMNLVVTCGFAGLLQLIAGRRSQPFDDRGEIPHYLFGQIECHEQTHQPNIVL